MELSTVETRSLSKGKDLGFFPSLGKWSCVSPFSEGRARRNLSNAGNTIAFQKAWLWTSCKWWERYHCPKKEMMIFSNLGRIISFKERMEFSQLVGTWSWNYFHGWELITYKSLTRFLLTLVHIYFYVEADCAHCGKVVPSIEKSFLLYCTMIQWTVP